MANAAFFWNRGSSFSFGLRVKAGTVTGLETVRCVAKAVPSASAPAPGDAAADAVVFMSTFVAAAGKEPAHWLFSSTAVLTPGFYICDARIDLGGGVIVVPDPVYLEVRERVSEVS